MANLFDNVKDPLIQQGPGSVEDYEVSAGDRAAEEWARGLELNPFPIVARNARFQFEKNRPFFGLESNMVSPEVARDELKSKGLDGQITIPNDGISRYELDAVTGIKQREINQQVMASRPQSMLSHVGAFGAGFAAGAVDPINIASAFIPVVTEARYAAWLAKAGTSTAGRAAVRVGAGALEGAVGAAIVEPIVYAGSQYEQRDYTLTDSFMNVAFGTILGGGLHALGGAVYDWRAARAMRSLDNGLQSLAFRDVAQEASDESQLDALRRFTQAMEDDAPPPDAHEILSEGLPRGATDTLKEADNAVDPDADVTAPVRIDGQPRKLDDLIEEAKADRTAETFNRQFTDAALSSPEQGPLSDIRPPREDVFEVAAANFTGATTHSAKTIPIDDLSGGVRLDDPAEAKRVKDLADMMGGPNGYVERLIVDSSGNVIEGQHRLEAMRKMGIKEVPVIEITDVRKDLPLKEMEAAIRGTGALMHPDSISSLIDRVAEAVADSGSAKAALAEYEPPKGFEKQWFAALDAIGLADDLKAQSAAAGPGTPEFKRWFRKSKVVDKNDEPLVVWHHGSFDENSDLPNGAMHFGTRTAALDRATGKRVDDEAMAVKAYQADDGEWHWEDGAGASSEDRGLPGYASEDVALDFGRRIVRDEVQETDFDFDDLGTLTGAYLSLQNPKRVADQGMNWDAAIAQAKQEDYDGIVYKNLYEDKGSESYIAFEPTQIKSVNNSGAFDPANPDIRAQSEPEPPQPYQDQDDPSKPSRLMTMMSASPWLNKDGGSVADELRLPGFDDRPTLNIDDPDGPRIIGTDAAGRPVLDFRDTVVSHFTDEESAADINENGYRVVGDGYYGEAISFTPNREFGNQFGGVETMGRISPDARILNSGLPEDSRIIQEVLNDRRLVPNNPRPGMRSWRQEFLRRGIDGVYDPGAGDLFIYNEKVVRPAAQSQVIDFKAMIGGEPAAPDTPEFKRWFGKSKIVDADGNPERVYHGTIHWDKSPEGFAVFDRTKGAYATHAKSFNAIGSFFTNSTDDANMYAGAATERYDPNVIGGHVMPVYLSIKSPFKIRGIEHLQKLWKIYAGGNERLQNGDPEKFREWAKSEGIDGFVVDAQSIDGMATPGSKYYIALEPTQIKSAIGNSGAYDPNLADIRAQSDVDEPGVVMDEDGGIEVWHASPHDFNKFVLNEKTLDTGEGGQMYSKGLYFAESEKVSGKGGEYWKQFWNKMKRGPEETAASTLFYSQFDRPKAITQLDDKAKFHEDEGVPGKHGYDEEIELGHRRLAANYRAAADMLRSGAIVGPRVYKARLKVKPEVLVHWDKPLSEQPDLVRKMPEIAKLVAEDKAYKERYPHSPIGERTGANLVTYVSEKKLLNYGIKGIKYLDAKSRENPFHIQLFAKDKPYGEPIPVKAKNQLDDLLQEYQEKGFETEVVDLGTYNYVIYDDDLIDIIDKFQSDLDEQPDLIAAHNLTAANLLHADKMGGIAAPSLAIAKASDGHDGYGEITLIGSKDLVDPQKGANVFAGDIYSARYPTVHYNIKYEILRKLDKQFAATAKEMGVTLRDTLDDDALEREGPRALENSLGALLSYAKEKGVKVDGYVFDREAWEVRYQEAQALERAISDEWQAKRKEEQTRALAEGRDPDETAIDAEFQPKFIAARNEQLAMSRQPERALDEIKYKLKDRFRNDSGFAEWAEAKFAELKAKERIFKGFSDRTGAKMYTPHTLDNVVKMMTKKLRDGEGFNYGIGNLRAKVAPQFKSVEAIRARKGSLVSKADFDAVKKEFDAEFMSIAEQIIPKSKYVSGGFRQLDDFVETLRDAIDKNSVKAALNAHYKNITNDDVRMVGNFLQKLKTMPTTYFEAKLDRAVKIGEFETAIVPNTISKKARETLESNGIKQIIEYDPAVEGSRQQAIDSARDLKFQSDILKELGFFSLVEKTIQDADLKKGTGTQWLGYLKNRPGVKGEELESTGLSDFLTENADEVLTKDQVLQRATDGAVELKEVRYGNLTRDHVRPDERAVEKYGDEWRELNLKRNAVYERRNNEQAAGNHDKADALGEEYERLNDQQNELHDKMVADTITRTGVDSGPPKYSKYTLPGGENYREIMLTKPMKDGEELTFPGPHFPVTNILAHARVSDRVTVSGKRALHVEEIQSDWHQQGREKGYATKEQRADSERRYREIEKKQRKLNDERERVAKKLNYMGHNSFWQYDQNKTPEQYIQFTNALKLDDGYLKALDEVNAASEEFTRSGGYNAGVADGPFKKTWHELMLKRLVRHAAENGYDEIVITRGEDIAERFDLSRQVSEIRYNRTERPPDAGGGDVYDLAVFDNNGDKAFSEYGVAPERLKDLVGKELTEKILKGEGKKDNRSSAYKGWNKMEGLDLKVGGEGMKGFYDKIVPDFLNKYGKKYGAKVGFEKISIANNLVAPEHQFSIRQTPEGADVYAADGNHRSFDSVAEAEAYVDAEMNKTATVLAFPITPELKAAVMKGQPLFQSIDDTKTSTSKTGTGSVTFKAMTAERRQRSERLRAEISDLVDKMSGGRVSPAFFESIEQIKNGRRHRVYGGFSKLQSAIVFSLQSRDLPSTARHEAVHALKSFGVFDDAEWDTLTRAAIEGRWVDKKYGTGQTIHTRYPGVSVLEKIEEAIAEEFGSGRHDLFQGYPKPLREVFLKMKQFFDRMAEIVRKIFGQDATAQDIFNQIERGEIGDRADVSFATPLKTPEPPQKNIRAQSTPEETPLKVDRWAADDAAISAQAQQESSKQDETLQDIQAYTAILDAHLDSMRQRGKLSLEDEQGLLDAQQQAVKMEEQAAAYEAAGICDGEGE